MIKNTFFFTKLEFYGIMIKRHMVVINVTYSDNIRLLFNNFTIAVDIWGILLLMIITIILVLKPEKNKSERQLFMMYTQMLLFLFCFLIIKACENVVSDTISGIYKISLFLYFMLEPMMIMAVQSVLRSSIKKEERNKTNEVLFYIGCFMMSAATFLLLYSIFNNIYYTVDINNHYNFSPFFITHYILCFGTLGIALYLGITYRNKRQRYIFVCGFVYSLMGLLGGILDLLFGVLGFVNVCITLGAIMTFISYEKNEVQTKMENRQELERMKTKLMMSQIQPHFLYNCLTSIIYISDKDPHATKNALLTFSKYLRMNLESIDKNSTIPFQQELDHTMAYLSLEKLRFGDDLDIKLDIKDKDFEVPVLCTQPLVENAVKHGIHKSESGSGKITIITNKAEGYHRITVIDDGVGFDTGILETLGDNHVGIRNVRRRLTENAGSELLIESAPGKGTKCFILIPEKGNCNEDNGN